jgi:hypothetical protein
MEPLAVPAVQELPRSLPSANSTTTTVTDHIPIKDTSPLIDVFRRRVLKLFVDRGLLDPHFARKMLSWKHSGFSMDNSVPISASNRKARVNSIVNMGIITCSGMLAAYVADLFVTPVLICKLSPILWPAQGLHREDLGDE